MRVQARELVGTNPLPDNPGDTARSSQGDPTITENTENDYNCPACGSNFDRESHRNQHYFRKSDEEHVKHRENQPTNKLEENDISDGNSAQDKSESQEPPVDPETDGTREGEAEQVKPGQKPSSNSVAVPEPEEDNDPWVPLEQVTPEQVEKAVEEHVDGQTVLDRVRPNSQYSEFNLETGKVR